MSAILVKHFKKYYQLFKKEPGLTGSIKSLFRREYEEVKAVDDISFEIEEGELIGFIGPNGAGKTTTLKALSGLLYPTSGNIHVLSYKPYERKHEFLRKIALVMGQKNQLWWDLPAMETMLLNKEIYGVSEKIFTTTLHELSALLDVTDLLKIPVRKLSLGERMKMELIAALIHSPRVLFLDEPTIGLDVVMQEKLREFIKEYNRRFNATIILTSHYMKDVEALAKRVIIINHGKILFDGELNSLVKKHAPYKIITVVLKDKVDIDKLKKQFDIKSYNFPSLAIRSEANIESAITKILKSVEINDLTIEDPDIEEIIRDIFVQQ